MNKTVTIRTRRTRSRAKDALISSSAMSMQDAAPDVLRAMIAEAAYYRAERRGFVPGYELEDWLIAEIELSARIQAQAVERRLSGREVH